jgi:hypothetical protein
MGERATEVGLAAEALAGGGTGNSLALERLNIRIAGRKNISAEIV